jgi:hypothetical protein
MSEVVEKLVAALNAHDLEAAAALFHENIAASNPRTPAGPLLGAHKCTPTGKRYSQAFPISTRI